MEKIFSKLNSYFKGMWNLAVLDLKKGLWQVDTDISNIPYLKAENSNGRHIIMQPVKNTEPYYLMVDDIKYSTIASHHKEINGTWKPGRMVIETSPGNYQMWIHSSRPLSLNEKRYWLEKMRNDPGADPNNRWGRCPGFRNRKEKYKDENGGYPIAKLIWSDWKNTVHIPRALIKIPDSENLLSPQPFGGVCQYKSRNHYNYECSDESIIDFSYALALMRRGISDEEVLSRILNERTDWKNHSGPKRMYKYLHHTISKARKITGKT